MTESIRHPHGHILITGASSGIGAALAAVYARNGCRLSLTGRDAERLTVIADTCRAQGAEVKTAVLDVRDSAAMALQLAAWDDESPIDIVIANAGISGGSGAAVAGSADSFRDIFSINIDGTLNTILPLIDRMSARRAGRIALMSSMAGWRGMPNAPAYSTSKVAVRALGEALRPLLRPAGVSVSVIFPGFVKTPLTDKNRFEMPFLMTAADAALYIKNGIDKGRARIAFPWPMYLLSRLVSALPLWLGDIILMRAPKK